jgi:hypothetical protein
LFFSYSESPKKIFYRNTPAISELCGSPDKLFPFSWDERQNKGTPGAVGGELRMERILHVTERKELKGLSGG